MTPEPDEAVYSSMATLHSMRIVIFLAELNGLNLMQGDVGNAYILRRIPKRKSILSMALSLVIMLAPHLSLRKHYMDYARVGCDFMSVYPKYSKASTLSTLMLTQM